MNYRTCSSLAVCLLAAGTVSANEDPAQSAGAAAAAAPPPAQVQVPNVPPELAAPPPAAQSGSQPPPEGIAPDPAASSVGLPPLVAAPEQQPDPTQLPEPTPPEDDCDTADCPGPRTAAMRAIPGHAQVTQVAQVAAPPSKPPVPVHIGVPARKALLESRDWAENPRAVPTLDPSGRVMFAYSESAPTIVCAPIHVCDIELQAGEVVQGAPHIGDSVRWLVSPAVSGTDEHRVTHLIIKPTEAGLDTNLIVPTDRHTYHVRLVSSMTRYVSSVGFVYPEEQQQQTWSEYIKTSSSGPGSGAAGSGPMPTVAVNRLNFNYKIKVVKGKPTFKPLRAMDDGYHTYIAMNEEMPQQEAPALIGISPTGEEQMINYRLKGNLYVVDGTIYKLALISGVGRHQDRIELTRDPCKQRGWLGICWDPKE
jgi:type IV secretion system protein TrbG